jgi:hypothetical protein
MKKTEEYLNRVNELIDLSNKTLATATNGQFASVNHELFANLLTSGLSCIKNMYGDNHPYYESFENRVRTSNPFQVGVARGILTAIKSEIEGGWFFSVKRLVTAEIFSDFIDMAQYLLDEGYKDPAAVMFGGILEEHLKQLSVKYGISLTYVNGKRDTVDKKADTLNSELVAAGVYNKLDQKQVTAWLDLRNKAAHGHYSEFTKEQVTQFKGGLLDFINRISL